MDSVASSRQHAFWHYLSCIIPDDSLGIKAEMDFDETDLLQLLLTNLSMVEMISNHFYTTTIS